MSREPGDPPPLPQSPQYRLEIGRIIQNSFSIWMKNFLPFTLLALLVSAPAVILGFSLYRGGMTQEDLRVAQVLIFVLLNLFLVHLLTATVTYGVFEQLRGRHLGMGTCLGAGLARLGPVLLVVLLQSLLVVLGFICLVFPGFMLLCAFYVAVPAAVVERPGITAALRRSAELTRGCRWAVFGLMLLFGLIVGMMNQALVFAFTAILDAAGTKLDVWNQQIVLLIAGVPFMALTAVVGAVLYHDLRVGKEGVAVEDLASVFE